MQPEWKDPRCILCLQPGALSREHIMPTSLGGKLECRFLCRDCNSVFSSDIEVAAHINFFESNSTDKIADVAKFYLS